MEGFSRDAVIESLLASAKDNSVDAFIRSHWARFVPLLFPAGPEPIKIKFDEAKITTVLLEPLEAYIAGNTAGANKFGHLKSNDLPSFLCNRSFRAGEPTYSCRDCAVDATCVLCIDCFKQSAHKSHRYKISSSSGGGYCDCGDPEAWKAHYACSQHEPPDGNAPPDINLEDARRRLPKDVMARFLSVVRFALSYSYQLLRLREGDDLEPITGITPFVDSGEDEYAYTTILYNDETHTYDQVINTLTRTLECSQEEALEYATAVDHEGRSCVKFGSMAECERIKGFIERNSRRPHPLRVDIIRTVVFAHQAFALKVMNWIQTMADVCEGFRALVCDICLEIPQNGEGPVVSALLLEDVRLWKAARSACHALFMSTFLAFNDAKIEFARLFANLYPQLMAAFITDDHDHSDSCTSLSVQLFTVPTVARTLFSDKLVEVILRSFVSICQARRNDQGRLTFDRTTQPATSAQFKRALYTLYDTRYLLNSVPTGDQWTDALRQGFIAAFDQFLQVMVMMEGMDGHVRRTQSHVEYETDWEPAFNVQLRMGPIIDQLQSWCGSEDTVLAACTERLLKEAVDAVGIIEKWEKKEVSRHVCECIEYDVASQVVSIHHPVIRMLAGVGVGALARLIDVRHSSKPLPVVEYLRQNAKILMEFPLRTLVLVAQASAGMWRRNGYALANQIFFYQQPRCREEMLDKDIVMMQICAAIMKPDDFLINMLNKFGLVQWADETFDASPIRADGDDSIRQVMYLAEEFLYCLMVFIGERFYPGLGKVTTDDCLRNEIIHQLCIQSMSYSELVKNLPEQDAKAASLDSIVREVAVFKRPSSASKGFFELLPEHTARYNMFFYHYSRIEHSKAEDTQRKRKKKDNEEIVFPPPCPPEFTEAFRPIIRIMESDVFIHLINLTVRRGLNHHPRSFSEGQLIRVLFLIGYALHEEKRARDIGRYDVQFVEKAADVGIFTTLRELRGQKDSETYKALVEWVLQFYDSMTKISAYKAEPMEVTEQATLDANLDDAEERRKRAAARRDRIMQQMKQAQTSFASQNVGELNEIALPDDGSQKAATIESPVPAVESLVVLGPGRSLHRADFDLEEKQTCILCSESHIVSLSNDAFVAVAYVQRSTVLSQQDRSEFVAEFIANSQGWTVKDMCQKMLGNPLYVPQTIPCAAHVSSCGHLLHAKCWKTYFDSVVARERRRTIRLRAQTGAFDVTKNEFRCPLCSRLCNAAVPLFPPVGQKEVCITREVLPPLGRTAARCYLPSALHESEEALGFSLVKILSPAVPDLNAFIQSLTALLVLPTGTWQSQTAEDMSGMEADSTSEYYHLSRAIRANLQSDSKTKLVAPLCESLVATHRLQGIDVKNAEIVTDTHVEAVRTFQNQVYQMAMNAQTAASNEDQCLSLSWAACSYSIQTVDTCLRFEKKSLLGSFSSRQYLCLKSLVRATCWSSAAYEQKIMMENAVKLFATLFNPTSDAAQNVLLMDPFTLLLNCTGSFPWLPCSETAFIAPYSDTLACRPPVGDAFDQHLLSIIYSLHVVQVLIGLLNVKEDDAQNMEDFGDVHQVHSEDEALRRIFATLKERTGDGKVPNNLERRVREAVWPFLRCSAIFYHFVTGIPAAEELKLTHQNADSEWPHLMDYLALPQSFTVLYKNRALGHLIDRWIDTCAASPVTLPKMIFPRPFSSLAHLPPDYIDVIKRASQNSGCRAEVDDRRSPALCLVCGALLCSQSMCCQYKMDSQTVGACTFHAAVCGGGTGLYLRVRENQVLLLHGSNKGCFASSPYVDEYGEPDPFLRRGNPLHLSVERVEQLHRHYMHHDIADEVSHAMDQNGTLAGFDWYHF